MRSSTSHSERLPRRLVLWLLFTAGGAMAACAVYTRWLNPEVRLYRHAFEVKRSWAHRMEERFGKKTIVFGGSSTSFAVDPALILERYGEPVANLGLHAGMGARFLTAAAASLARRGDLLLMAMEPGLLTDPDPGSDLAAQTGFALDHFDWVHASNITDEPVHWVEDLVSLRPGAYHFFTLLAKLALGRPLYRYHLGDFTETGWQRTQDRRPIPDASGWSAELSPDAVALLEDLRAWSEARGVRLAYLLPWRYASPQASRDFQLANLRFLLQVARYLPVLADPRLGAYSVREHFADTPYHLLPEGAAVRSDELGRLLREGRFWTAEDLQRELRRRESQKPVALSASSRAN